jgi:hypothetical protein
MNSWIRQISICQTETPGWSGDICATRLLGRPTSDVDIAVQGDAKALAVRFARAHGSSVFPLDVERGTYRVVLEISKGKI